MVLAHHRDSEHDILIYYLTKFAVRLSQLLWRIISPQHIITSLSCILKRSLLNFQGVGGATIGFSYAANGVKLFRLASMYTGILSVQIARFL